MKILLLASAGKLDFYLEDMAFFLRSHGAECEFYPLNELGKTSPFNFFLAKQQKREAALKKVLKEKKPDILIVNSSRPVFDLLRLKNIAGKCKVVIYDMEGPNYSGFHNLSRIKHADMIITVSKYSAEKLSADLSNIFYLPHAVNTERFYPVEAPPVFRAPAAFVGRPTPHRNELLSCISDMGLHLYGRKWQDPKSQVPEQLRNCCPLPEDVHGNTLLQAISGADIFVNILQDQFKDLKTLMNLQTFMVPACRRCLLTEYTGELPDTFETGREVLAFHTADELRELAAKYTRDRKAAAAIGNAAWQRCLRDHTLRRRSRQILDLLNQL